jgi:DNA-binding Lrp family transcriptional regulator
MFTAFVLIKTLPGNELKVHDELLKIQEVGGVRTVFGEYDIIARVEASDFKKLKDIVLTKIRHINGITATTTLIAAEEEESEEEG